MATPPAHAQRSAPPPARRPHYKLLGRIASGGMGSVYLGAHVEDPALSRLVAIKVVHEHLAHNRMFIDMLLDEAKVAGKLRHPNVVGTIDFGEFQGRHFVVMPYVEGGTLSELVRRHRKSLPVGLLVRAVIDALGGLHAAHTMVDEQGRPLALVHRDVSPGNILVGTDGVARVIDFGVAKAASRITHTAPGTVKGKFSYMAPEQAMGEKVDHRADVFSAGVVLWTVLTGKRLFTGKNSAHTIRNLMTAEILPPSRIRPSLPQCFDEVCLRALQRDPGERYQSAAEMAEALYSAAILSEVLLATEEVSRWVSEAFARRISQRRALIERVRAEAGSAGGGQESFDLDVADLDGREPGGSATPPAPGGRVKGAPAGILEQLGADDLSSGIRRVDRHKHDPFSGIDDLSSSVRGMRASITPGEAPSVSDVTPVARPKPSGAARDHAGEPGQESSGGRGKRIAALAVLLGLLAGTGFVLREHVTRLASDWGVESWLPGVSGDPGTRPPVTIEPVIIQVDDIADAALPAAAHDAGSAARPAAGPAQIPAQPPETVVDMGSAAEDRRDGGTPSTAHAGDDMGETEEPATEPDQAAAGEPARRDTDGEREQRGADGDTAGRDTSGAARDRDEDRSRSRARKAKQSKSRKKSGSRREPRHTRQERDPDKTPPVKIEKPPYVEKD